VTPASDRSGSAPEVGARSHGSVGSYLARQRRLRGISLEELARATRIPQRSLERLEAGAFDTVSDGFVRGFVRTVALALGLDDDEAVSRLLVEPGKPTSGGSRRGLFSRRLVALVGLLMLLGLGVAAAFALIESLTPEGSRPLVRRDPVRALQEASRADTPSEGSARSVPAAGESGRP